MRPLSLDAIGHASDVIDPVFLNSPQIVADVLSTELGCELTLKIESINPIRSFKGRGAEYFVHTCEDDRPLVCASAGNFGQGLAWAARRRGRNLTVYAATTANPLKIKRMQDFGANVVLEGFDFDAAKDAARAFATANGHRYVEDGREPAIAEGAGTIASELLARGLSFDAMVIPLGNGALLGGIAAWVKAHAPRTQLYGVCASGAPAMERSWRARRAEETATVATIADGIAVRVPIEDALATLYTDIDDVLLVDDATTLDAMRTVLNTTGLLVEPAGAVGVAALSAYRDRFATQRVATVLCGSNVTSGQLNDWFGGKAR